MQTDRQWPFAEPKNVAAFTTKQIIKDGKAILLVTHDAEDGAWQFHCGDAVSNDDIMVVALSEIFARDPTIGELSDLPLGWKAVRSTSSNPWIRIKNSDE